MSMIKGSVKDHIEERLHVQCSDKPRNPKCLTMCSSDCELLVRTLKVLWPKSHCFHFRNQNNVLVILIMKLVFSETGRKEEA